MKGGNSLLRPILVGLLVLGLAPVSTRAAESTLMLAGSSGRSYVIQGSNDMVDWQTASTLYNEFGVLEIPQTQLGGYQFYRVFAAGGAEPVAIGMSVFENVADSNEAAQTRVAARDRALAAIAGAQGRYTRQELQTLFCGFAAQEVFNATTLLGSTAGTEAAKSLADRVVGVLGQQQPSISAAELSAIRSEAMANGLVGGIIANGGSSSEAIAGVLAAVQELDAGAQQAAFAKAQAAAITALSSQLAGMNGTDLLLTLLGITPEPNGSGGNGTGGVSNSVPDSPGSSGSSGGSGSTVTIGGGLSGVGVVGIGVIGGGAAAGSGAAGAAAVAWAAALGGVATGAVQP